MCFGNGQKEDPDAKKSREIEKQLREDQKRMAKEVKLLLLGMRFLHVRYGNMLDETLTSHQERESLESPQC